MVFRILSPIMIPNIRKGLGMINFPTYGKIILELDIFCEIELYTLYVYASSQALNQADEGKMVNGGIAAA
jgi:hypothetical protein